MSRISPSAPEQMWTKIAEDTDESSPAVFDSALGDHRMYLLVPVVSGYDADPYKMIVNNDESDVYDWVERDESSTNQVGYWKLRPGECSYVVLREASSTVQMAAERVALDNGVVNGEYDASSSINRIDWGVTDTRKLKCELLARDEK